MKKSSRKYTARLDRTSFNPYTEARAREDLRSVDRPVEDVRPDRPAVNRGLIEDNEV